MRAVVIGPCNEPSTSSPPTFALFALFHVHSFQFRANAFSVSKEYSILEPCILLHAYKRGPRLDAVCPLPRLKRQHHFVMRPRQLIDEAGERATGAAGMLQ